MPIRWKLTLFNALAIGAILAVLGLFFLLLLRDAARSGVEDIVRERAQEIARTVETGDAPGPDELERLALDGVFVVVRDEEGQVLYRSVDLARRQGDARDPVWHRALASGKPASGSAEISSEPPDFVHAVPVGSPDGRVRVVEAAKPYESSREALEFFGAALAGAIVLVVLLTAGGAYLLARAALAPVDAVVASARQITEGDLSKRLPVVREKDEIGRLAATINDLLARLETAFARRASRPRPPSVAPSPAERRALARRAIIADDSNPDAWGVLASDKGGEALGLKTLGVN